MFFRRADHRDELIRRLMQQNSDLLDRFQEMVGTVHAYQVAHHARENANDPATFSISGEEASWKPDHEYDLEDAEEAGFIDPNTMMSVLRAEGLLNTEIDFE